MQEKEESIFSVWDLCAALSALVLVSFVMIKVDFFDHWHEITRPYEHWELDEVFSIVFGSLCAGTILAIRKIISLHGVIKRLRETKEALNQSRESLIQREKLIALGEISGGLAHEINNTLQPVLGLSEVLKNRLEKEGANEDLRNFANVIHHSALHACTIIGNVLAFARGEKNPAQLYNASMLFTETVQFAEELLPPGVKVEKSGFDIIANSPVQSLYISKINVLQILINLFKNAAHAMNNSGIIRLRLGYTIIPPSEIQEHDLKQNDFIVLDVEDEGCGMDSETMKRIFNPFFSTKGLHEGTGLGLSTVYGIMKKAGGYVTVKSRKGAGSVFSLYFPVPNEMNINEEIP